LRNQDLHELDCGLRMLRNKVQECAGKLKEFSALEFCLQRLKSRMLEWS